jgi:hypothetical protein
MFALSLLPDCDLICALPRRFASAHASRFGVASVDAPVPLGGFTLNVVVPQVALMDAGLAWLVARIMLTAPSRASKAQRGKSTARAVRSSSRTTGSAAHKPS